MYTKKVAKEIVKRVKKEQISLVSSDSHFIEGYRTLKYFYSDEGVRLRHSKTLLAEGYKLLDHKQEGLYVDLMSDGSEDIYVLVGIYIKYGYYKPFI